MFEVLEDKTEAFGVVLLGDSRVGVCRPDDSPSTRVLPDRRARDLLLARGVVQGETEDDLEVA